MLRLILEIGPVSQTLGFSDGSAGKESSCNARDAGSFPGLGRFPGEENGNPLQYSCLENSMDRGAWWATVPWGCQESDWAIKQACMLNQSQGTGWGGVKCEWHQNHWQNLLHRQGVGSSARDSDSRGLTQWFFQTTVHVILGQVIRITVEETLIS